MYDIGFYNYGKAYTIIPKYMKDQSWYEIKKACQEKQNLSFEIYLV